MSDLFGNHIVGFPTRWLIYFDGKSGSVCVVSDLFVVKREISEVIKLLCLLQPLARSLLLEPSLAPPTCT